MANPQRPVSLRVLAFHNSFRFKITLGLDLDRFEMASQGLSVLLINLPLLISNSKHCLAFEYEKNHQTKTLQPFFDSSLPKIRHPEVRQWGEDLLVEREQLQRASSTGASQVD